MKCINGAKIVNKIQSVIRLLPESEIGYSDLIMVSILL